MQQVAPRDHHAVAELAQRLDQLNSAVEGVVQLAAEVAELQARMIQVFKQGQTELTDLMFERHRLEELGKTPPDELQRGFDVIDERERSRRRLVLRGKILWCLLSAFAGAVLTWIAPSIHL